MSDNTTVNLVLLKEDYAAHKSIFHRYGRSPLCELTEKEGVLVCVLTFEDVDCAQLNIEDDLQALCIPFTKTWGPGLEYGEGTEDFRIRSDGSTKLFSGDDIDTFSYAEVKRSFEKDEIVDLLEDRVLDILLLRWENQKPIIDSMIR